MQPIRYDGVVDDEMQPDQALDRRERTAVARLHALLELLPTALDRELAPGGVTSFEFTLLEALHDAPDQRMRLSALAARTNATLPRLSRVVTSLEKKGLVDRAPCLEDGRATNAVLTPAGLATYLSSRPRYAAAVRRMILAGLDGSGIDALAGMSYAILTNLDPDARATTSGAAQDCPADGAPICPADPAGGAAPSAPTGNAALECPADPPTAA